MAGRPGQFGNWRADEQLRRFDNELFFPSVPPEETIIDDDDEPALEVPPRYDRTASRKRKATALLPPLPRTPPVPHTPPMTIMSPPQERPSAGDETNTKARVKTEEEMNAIKALGLRPAEERVKIFVGKTNQVFKVAIEALDKSPVLKSLVCQDVVGEESYVMHPLLTRVDVRHFQAVRHFLIMDEYDPFVISNPGGPEVFPKRLDGLRVLEDYQKEAVRACHLYVIAKQLGMGGLEDLVRRKITEAQFFPYGIKCLLEMAMVVFSRVDVATKLKRERHTARGSDSGDAANGDGHDDDGANNDKLEDWLIGNLITKLQAVLLNHAQLFFRVANVAACKKRGFAVRIFRGKVEEWERDGPDVVAIEDDE